MRGGGSRDCLRQRCIACVGICTDVYFVELMIRTRSLDNSYHGQLIYVSMLGTHLLPAYFGKAIRASERGWKHQTPVFHAVRVEGR